MILSSLTQNLHTLLFTGIVNNFCDTAEVSVGQHLYWQIGNLQVHGQVLITSWIVFAIIITLSIVANSNLKVSFSKNSNWGRRISYLGSILRNYLSIYFCFELVRSSFSMAAY